MAVSEKDREVLARALWGEARAWLAKSTQTMKLGRYISLREAK
ncbi:hypothetical protein ALP94_04609 [Pseudomonas savastanoi pv. glycinea]|nr:hypothetical protein ALP94_04609 [Pseudomonas savastanoi pv. glycinea]